MNEPVPIAQARAVADPFSPPPHQPQEPDVGGADHSYQAPPYFEEVKDTVNAVSPNEDKASSSNAASGGKKGLCLLLSLAIAGVVALGSGLGVGLSVANNKSKGVVEDPSPSPTAESPSPTTIQVAMIPTVAPSMLPSFLPTLEPTAVRSETPSAMPSVAPSTEITQICQTRLDAYVECSNTKLNVIERQTCAQCALDFLNITGSQLCTDWTIQFCTTIPTDECSCGECVDSLHSLMDCNLGNRGCLDDCSVLDTPSVSPSRAPSMAPSIAPSAATAPVETPCSALTAAYQQCLTRLTDAQTQECTDCGNEVIRTVPRNTCEEYVDGMCRGFNQCNCGWCTDEMLEWADCAIDGDQCTIDCSTVPGLTSDAPSSVPTSVS